ncbi:MAG: hypothetical protein PF692_05100 [Kiritimatiellae bacterium]|jgi:hypothetical protein|nr:hypothetical protein [Kiritimatiellia bacterium]
MNKSISKMTVVGMAVVIFLVTTSFVLANKSIEELDSKSPNGTESILGDGKTGLNAKNIIGNTSSNVLTTSYTQDNNFPIRYFGPIQPLSMDDEHDLRSVIKNSKYSEPWFALIERNDSGTKEAYIFARLFFHPEENYKQAYKGEFIFLQKQLNSIEWLVGHKKRPYFYLQPEGESIKPPDYVPEYGDYPAFLSEYLSINHKILFTDAFIQLYRTIALTTAANPEKGALFHICQYNGKIQLSTTSFFSNAIQQDGMTYYATPDSGVWRIEESKKIVGNQAAPQSKYHFICESYRIKP